MKFNNEHKEIVENRGYIYIGSYERNEKTIDKKLLIIYNKYIRIQCPYCKKEYDIHLTGFINGSDCTNCCHEYKNSLAYHIQQELKEPLSKYWDWEKNTLNPYHIYKSSKHEVWIKCNKTNYHGSYELTCNKFYNKRRCPYCKSKKVHINDSFAQYHIDNTDKNFLEKYWSDKNTLNPFELSFRSGKKVWVKCQNKDYHYDYEVTCDDFTKGARCPACVKAVHKTHPFDSFGVLYPEKAKHWSNKNKISVYDVAPMDNKEYWFVCEKCHKPFKRRLIKINRKEAKGVGVICRECNASKGEKRIKNYLDKYKIKYIYDAGYFNDLLSEDGNRLRPDFILPKQRIWIEYDGEFHYQELYKGDSHDILVKHDKLKNEYAKKNNWKLIRIPYWDYDDIEKILDKELNKGEIDSYGN